MEKLPSYSPLKAELSVFQDRFPLFSTSDLNSLLVIHKFWIVFAASERILLEDTADICSQLRDLWAQNPLELFIFTRSTQKNKTSDDPSHTGCTQPTDVWASLMLVVSHPGWAAWHSHRTGPETQGQSSPWPPGYIQRKARPSSSAWTLPAGVSSPPHLSTRRRDGEDSRRASRRQTGTHYIRSQSWACRGRGGEEEKVVISTLQSVLNTNLIQNPQEPNQQVQN